MGSVDSPIGCSGSLRHQGGESIDFAIRRNGFCPLSVRSTTNRRLCRPTGRLGQILAKRHERGEIVVRGRHSMGARETVQDLPDGSARTKEVDMAKDAVAPEIGPDLPGTKVARGTAGFGP